MNFITFFFAQYINYGRKKKIKKTRIKVFFLNFSFKFYSSTVRGNKKTPDLTLLLGEFFSFRLFQFSDSGGRFTAKKSTSPVTSDFIVTIVEVRLDSLHNLSEIGPISRVNLKKTPH